MNKTRQMEVSSTINIWQREAHYSLTDWLWWLACRFSLKQVDVNEQSEKNEHKKVSNNVWKPESSSLPLCTSNPTASKAQAECFSSIKEAITSRGVVKGNSLENLIMFQWTRFWRDIWRLEKWDMITAFFLFCCWKSEGSYAFLINTVAQPCGMTELQ